MYWKVVDVGGGSKRWYPIEILIGIGIATRDERFVEWG